MPADAPTILATSGGIKPGRRTHWEFSALTDYAVELSGVTGRAPRVCFLATAYGDDSCGLRSLHDAAQVRGFAASHLALFPMPNVDDVTALLLDQDVVWVGGGSVAGLLAMWRLHGVDIAMRAAWQAGVVLTGISAGSICWHVGGTTDSFGPELRPVTDALGLVPYSNGVHYDSEEQRRPLFHKLIADGTLPAGYATDDGAGVLYRGTDFVDALSECDSAAVFRQERGRPGRGGSPRYSPALDHECDRASASSAR
jgi:peptidase E